MNMFTKTKILVALGLIVLPYVAVMLTVA